MSVGVRMPDAGHLNMVNFDDGASLSDTYSSAFPFPHIVLDGRFDEVLLDQIRGEIAAIEVDPERNVYASFRKRRISTMAALPPTARSLIEALNSPRFIAFLEELTGIPNLVADPTLQGGGIHQIGTGGFLKMHTDFNWHGGLKLHRRLNALLYLNRDWDPAWNGQLELWTNDMSRQGQKIDPIFNRLVIFSTTDSSYHGHPEPLACPDDVTRNSIALYYYSAERPAAEVRFGQSEFTNYRERPDEAFSGGRLKHRIHQFLIRHPRLRAFLGR